MNYGAIYDTSPNLWLSISGTVLGVALIAHAIWREYQRIRGTQRITHG